MNQLVIKGIAPSNLQDDRTLILLDVTYNDEVFAWETRMSPTFTGSFQSHIEAHSTTIYADIQNKLTEWENLSPKTRQINIGEFSDKIITVPITREEIVKPTYPDYYVLRANEYPSLAEQMDAVWKGNTAQQTMQEVINAIKLKYPK